MRADEIRDMSKDAITQRVKELEEEQFRLPFRSPTEPLEDPNRLRVIRHALARLKTVLNAPHPARALTPGCDDDSKFA